jgi:hypothetical protein
MTESTERAPSERLRPRQAPPWALARQDPAVASAGGSRLARGVVWTVALVAVGLPQIGIDLSGRIAPGWLPVGDVIMVASALALSILWRPLRPFTRFLLVLLALQPAVHSGLWPSALATVRFDLPGGQPSLSSEFILELALALGLLGVLLMAGLRRRQLFLGLGRSGALAAPIRGLFDRAITWSRLGPVSAVLIGAGTLAFLAVGIGLPSIGKVQAVLPAVLLFAAINAFNEEALFRAAPMATLDGPLGRREATLLAVAHFAIPHYFGVPFGLVGVAMAAVLGWWLFKCLVETRGLLWPWIIHVVQDIAIFGVLLAGTGD